MRSSIPPRVSSATVGRRGCPSPNPDTQLNVMNARVISLIAPDRASWPLAGDQLFVDLDLGDENLPPGTQIEIGERAHRGECRAAPGMREVRRAVRRGRDEVRQLAARPAAPPARHQRARRPRRRGASASGEVTCAIDYGLCAVRAQARLLAAAALLAILISIYGPGIGKGFVKDDVVWVGANHVTSWSDVRALLFRTDGFYRPVVAATFAIDRALYGVEPFGFGVTNLCLLAAGASALAYLGPLGFAAKAPASSLPACGRSTSTRSTWRCSGSADEPRYVSSLPRCSRPRVWSGKPAAAGVAALLAMLREGRSGDASADPERMGVGPRDDERARRPRLWRRRRRHSSDVAHMGRAGDLSRSSRADGGDDADDRDRILTSSCVARRARRQRARGSGPRVHVLADRDRGRASAGLAASSS